MRLPYVPCRPSFPAARAPDSPMAALALAALLAGVAAPAARAAELGKLTRITAGDPFAGCVADNVPQQKKAGSVLYPATEIEPWVTVDPGNPDRLLAGWQQDRWDDGGSRGLLAGRSSDGGVSWKTVPSGPVTKCEGGPWARDSDPWVDIGPTGTAYFIHLPFQPDLPNGGFGPNAVSVTRSTDGGRTWSKEIILI